MAFDWHQFYAEERPQPAVVDPRRRMRLGAAAFFVALAVVLARVVQLEVAAGDAFRTEASKPLSRRIDIPGLRGRILARDGTVLACDHKVLSLAIHYRYLEEPCNRSWLRLAARSRLSPAQRKDFRQVAAEEERLLGQRRALAVQLAALCGMTPEQWDRRARQIQARVERIADNVNRRRLAEAAQTGPEPLLPDPAQLLHGASAWRQIGVYAMEVLRSSMGETAAAHLTVAEERDYHVIVEDISLPVVAEVEAHPDLYQGVKIVERSRRHYPAGALAAHVLGYLGPDDEGPQRQNTLCVAADVVGKAGLEREYERLLRGRRGTAVELVDHTGRLLSTIRDCEPEIGRDLVLTIQGRLQAAAETLLDRALERRAVAQLGQRMAPSGGAIVVLDVRNGAILAAASAPRFEPSLFGRGSSPELSRLLVDPAHPLFDRVAGMAIPPGSVFKIVTAAALLESATIDPMQPLECKGYLDNPDRWRCEIYQRHGVRHGPLALADALAESCNVYFLHHARRMGPSGLVDWSERFGFGRPTGIDLPGEAGGIVPDGQSIQRLEKHSWRTADTLAMSIGQGVLSVTPLQMARLLAAVANGGYLVTPHLVADVVLPESTSARFKNDGADAADDPLHIPPPQVISGLHEATLAAIREGLARVVADPRGTGHATIWTDRIAVAGKTGTAETGADRADHAWFAGYVPAERPQLAFVVVLEHAGDAATAAGPVVKKLVEQIDRLGLLRKDEGGRTKNE
jgi:penicillin-binding protein 2